MLNRLDALPSHPSILADIFIRVRHPHLSIWILQAPWCLRIKSAHPNLYETFILPLTQIQLKSHKAFFKWLGKCGKFHPITEQLTACLFDYSLSPARTELLKPLNATQPSGLKEDTQKCFEYWHMGLKNHTLVFKSAPTDQQVDCSKALRVRKKWTNLLMRPSFIRPHWSRPTTIQKGWITGGF